MRSLSNEVFKINVSAIPGHDILIKMYHRGLP